MSARPGRSRLRSMICLILVPGMLSQVFRRKSSRPRWLFFLMGVRTDELWRSARQIWNSRGTRVLGARMHSLSELLKRFKPEFCCRSLGSDLLLLVLKLLLNLDVEVVLCVASLAPRVHSLIRAGAEFGERD